MDEGAIKAMDEIGIGTSRFHRSKSMDGFEGRRHEIRAWIDNEFIPISGVRK